jgi:hypothetical protein
MSVRTPDGVKRRNYMVRKIMVALAVVAALSGGITGALARGGGGGGGGHGGGGGGHAGGGGAHIGGGGRFGAGGGFGGHMGGAFAGGHFGHGFTGPHVAGGAFHGRRHFTYGFLPYDEDYYDCYNGYDTYGNPNCCTLYGEC